MWTSEVAMSTDVKSSTSRVETPAAVPGKSFWVVLVIACVLVVYAVAVSWMDEWVWPGVLTGETETVGTTESESTGATGFPLWAGLFLAGVVGLLGMALLTRRGEPPSRGRGRLRLLAVVALVVGIGGLVGAFLEVAEANTAAAEGYFDALSDRERLDLIWGGAEAAPGGGLSNAVIALPFAALPIGLMLGLHGPRLLAGLGALLALASFAVPWRSATTLHTDHLEYHDFWFTIYSGKLSWLLLLGTVVFIVIVVAVFRSRGAVQALLGVASVIYFLALSVASMWANEYEPDEDRPIEASLADALHVHTRDPVWPEALTLQMAGAACLLGAALWHWRATARRHRRRAGEQFR
jgi:hypothetical protein